MKSNYQAKTKRTSNDKAAYALIATTLAIASYLPTTAALAQEQDNLLPPDVVPLDQSAASSMQQSEAQARATSMGMQQAEPMQSAQEARQAAFDSLMNKGQMPPQLQGQPFQPQTLAQNQGPLAAAAGSTNLQSQTLSGSVKSSNLKGQDAVHKGTAFAKLFMTAAGLGMYGLSFAMMARSYGGYGRGAYIAPLYPAPAYTVPTIGSGYYYPYPIRGPVGASLMNVANMARF